MLLPPLGLGSCEEALLRPCAYEELTSVKGGTVEGGIT